MSSKFCVVCKEVIPGGRLEIFPDTDVCAVHSRVVKKLGCPAYSHKTGGGLMIVEGNATESIRLLDRQYRRRNTHGG